MKETMDEMNFGKYKWEPFFYFMSAILFWKMGTQTKLVWNSDVVLECGRLSRKLMY